MGNKERFKKILSVLLALVMVLQYVPVRAAAAQEEPCVHHTAHTDACSYLEGEQACGFLCEECAAPAVTEPEPAEVPAEELTEAPTEAPTEKSEKKSEKRTDPVEDKITTGDRSEMEVNAATPTYIAGIAVSYGSKESTPKNILTGEGYTVINYDLNKGCGSTSAYVYMGYKTTTDPSKAITGIFIRKGSNPPASAIFDGVTAYLLGGSGEANPGENKAVDLNVDAGGDYLYVYVTRDASCASVTEITFSGSSSKTDYVTPAVNLNSGTSGITKGDAIYLHYKQFSETVSATYYYLTSGGFRTSSTQTGTVKHHQDPMTKVPSYLTSVTYDGRTFSFQGWREDNSAEAPSTTSPSVTYMNTPKSYRAVYTGTLTLSYNANGGTGAPGNQTATQYINAGSSSLGVQTKGFTVSSTVPTHSGKCSFLGWDTSSSATSAAYTAGSSISLSGNATLYAVWKDHADGNSDSFCDSCGQSLDEPALSSGVYQISNKYELIWFMQEVNRGNKNINGKLTADIDMDGYNWTPIASTGLYYKTTTYNNPDAGYTGTFDGNGKVISNLKMTTSTSVEQTYGLFGTISGTVKNLGMTGVSYTFPSGAKDLRAGGIVGQMLPGSTVTDCYVVDSTINPGQYIVGGIAACNYGGTIANCYTKNVTVKANDRCGNLVSDTSGDIGDKVSDRPGTVTNCYTDAARVVGTQSGNKVTGCEASVSAERFASGEIACKLNDGKTSGQRWFQTCGEGLPAFSGSTVYQVTLCDGKTIVWRNTTDNHTGSFVEGFCSGCQKLYEEPALVNGYYQIYNAGQLYWFAQQVNGGKTSINGQLMDDIVVNKNVLKDDGTLNGTPSREWTPIGNNSRKYTGTFDGYSNDTSHTISGLYFDNSSTSYVGLFGYVGENGKIQNVGVVDSYFCGGSCVGGVAGCVYNSSISNSYNMGSVSGTGDRVGGVVGYVNYYSSISNSYNTGSVSGTGNRVGGVAGCVYNSSISNSYNTDNVSGDNNVGGVAGYVYDNSSVSNSYNTGNVSGTGNYVGGVAGHVYESSISNSYNSGNVSGTGYHVGGVAGYVDYNSSISNSYNTGNVSGDNNVGGVAGYNNQSTVSNCYYLDKVGEYTNPGGINGSDVVGQAEKMTADQFASGEVAYLLQGEQTEQVWGQNIDNDKEKQKSPVLDGAKVYQYQIKGCNDEVYPDGYSNSRKDAVITHNYVNGFCEFCDGYEPAKLLTEEDCEALELSTEFAGYYAIGNAGQLYWFVALVNGGETSANAILTADIVVNKNVLNEDGTLNGTPSREWTPIGNDTKNYAGTFEGNNKTISGLYFNDATKDTIGLFGCTNGGTIQNLGVVDSYFRGYHNVGGVVGFMSKSTVSNCYNAATVEGNTFVGGVVGEIMRDPSGTSVSNCYNTGIINGDTYVGGVAGRVERSTIISCYNTGTVSGSYDTGGVVGQVDESSATNCYNTGSVEGTENTGGVVGDVTHSSITVSNCYNIGTVSGSYNTGGVAGYVYYYSSVSNCYYLDKVGEYTNPGGINGSDVEGQAEKKTIEQFKSGEVAYLLGEAFGQNIDNGETKQDFPVLSDAAVYRYRIGACSAETYSYSNTRKDDVISHGAYDNGFCILCDGYEAAELENGKVDVILQSAGDSKFQVIKVVREITGLGLKEAKELVDNCPQTLKKEISREEAENVAAKLEEFGAVVEIVGKNGVYLIYNAGQLYWFAEQVNSGNTGINGKLMDKIVVNTNVLDEEGNLNDGTFRTWTPIGSDSMRYTGTFEGSGQTVSGLYFNDDTADYVGLFGYTEDGTIQNVGVVGSYFCGNKYVGGVAGDVTSQSSYNDHTALINCYNTSRVIGNRSVGGVAGLAHFANVINCYNTGVVSGGENVGGVAGSASMNFVKYCWNTANISGGDYVGGVIGQATSNEVWNCWNTGDITGNNFVGGVAGACESLARANNCYSIGKVSGVGKFDPVSVRLFNYSKNSNCYYLDTCGTAAEATAMTIEQFKSGEVAYLLQGEQTEHIWGQLIGIQDYPVLFGEKVFFDESVGYYNECVVAQISWTAMEFTYTSGEWDPETHTYADGEWTKEEGNGQVTVTNKGAVSVDVQMGFTSEMEGVAGTLTAPGAHLPNNGVFTNELTIGGIPAESGFVDASLGHITVTVTASDAAFGEVSDCTYVDGTATCGHGSVCSVCGGYRDDVDPDNHADNTNTDQWTMLDEKNHGRLCSECGQPLELAQHTPDRDATCTEKAHCSVCGEYGDLSHTCDDNGFCTNTLIDGEICGEYEPAVQVDGVYEIRNAGQLYWFAQRVNGGETGLNARLMNNITVNKNVLDAEGNLNEGTYKEWTPIGNNNKQYAGTFDGQCHTISGLYFNNPGASYVGLFGCVATGGTVKNLGLVDSYFYADTEIGGIAGKNSGSVINCYNAGKIVCYSWVGGVVGRNFKGSVINCYNVGSITGQTDKYVGAVAVNGIQNPFGTVTNCFYLSGCAIGYGTPQVGLAGDQTTGSKDKAGQTKGYTDFSTGEVAYLLQGDQETHVWGQKIGVDPYPVLGGDAVYRNVDCQGAVSYSNTQSSVHDIGDDLVCSVCGSYEPAVLVKGVYEISNASQLYWFAQRVNGGETGLNARLMNNITVNSKVLDADGNLNEGTYRAWTPIGSDSKRYAGTFDGQGHTISGLYFNNPNASYVGLVGCAAAGGTVKNVGVVDSCFYGGSSVGGIVGENYGSIANCYHTGSVDGNFVGGIVGRNSGGSVTNCYNIGSVHGQVSYTGAIAGFNGSDFMSGPVTNCFYLPGCASGFGVQHKGLGCSMHKESIDIAGWTTPYTDFSTGEVAYLLQGEQTEQIWGQKIGVDPYPVLGGDAVYRNVDCQGAVSYSNTQSSGHDIGDDLVCSVCGSYEPAVLAGDVYEISNASQLYWFAQEVNGGETGLNARLMNNITVNKNVLDAEGNLNEGTYKEWTPIGNNNKRYAGIFDGQGHTISGLYFNNPGASYVGLFGYAAADSTVKNVGVVDSYFCAYMEIGGIVGINSGSVINCYNIGRVTAHSFVGGVAGRNRGNIINCYNAGRITTPNPYTGAVTGYSGYGGRISNCFYLSGSAGSSMGVGQEHLAGTDNGTKPRTDFSTGEVAYLLQGDQETHVWGQKIGVDPYPVLGGPKVVLNDNGEYVNE